MCPFNHTAVAGSGKVGPVSHVNHTSWEAVVTPTDHPKSVRNRCVIEFFLWRCLCCHFALMTFLLVYEGCPESSRTQYLLARIRPIT